MAYGQEIRFKIGGDTSSLKRSFSEAESIAERAGKAMERSLSKAMSPKMRADQTLSNFYKQQRYEEANTVGKIKIVTQDLARLAQIRERSQQGGVKYLQTQLAIEQKLLTLRRLQGQAQNERTGGIGVGGASGGSSSGRSPEQSSALNSTIFRIVGGVITAVLRGIIGYQHAGIQVAGAQEASNAGGLASLQNRFATIGGLQGQLRQGQLSEKNLEGDKDFYEQRKSYLSTGVLAKGVDFLTKMGLAPDELTKVEVKIQEINAALQQQHDTNALIERDLQKQIDLAQTYSGHAKGGFKGGSFVGPDGVRHLGAIYAGPETGAIPETEAAMRSGKLNSVTSAQIELKRLQAAYQVENRLGNPQTQKTAYLAMRSQRVEVEKAQMNMRALQSQTNQTFSEEAAGGRTFRNGAHRPRSETERLADRAAMFRNRARNLILSGSTGNGAGASIDAARADETSVAGRLARAASSVKAPGGTSDLTGLKASVDNSALILGEIRDSLKPTSVK